MREFSVQIPQKAIEQDAAGNDRGADTVPITFQSKEIQPGFRPILKITKTTSQSSKSIQYFGATQVELKNLDAGIIHYKKAIEILPEFAVAHFNCGRRTEPRRFGRSNN